MSGLGIPGLSSGMDTKQMVKDLMKAERGRLLKYEQNKQMISWKKERYNEVSKEWANFIVESRKIFGIGNVSSFGGVSNSTINNLSWTKQAVVSDTSALKVTALHSSPTGSYNMKIHQLASNTSVASTGNVTTGTGTDSLANQFNLTGADIISFTIETHNGVQEFDYTDLANTSIQDIVSDINNSDLGVKAVYDESIDRFFLQTEETGQSKYMKISNNTTTTTSTANFMSGAGNLLNLSLNDGQTYSGQNAIFDYNGATGIEKDTNAFTLNGSQFQLLKADATDVTVSIDTDVDEVYNKINDFVNKYNEMMEKVYNVMQEKRDVSFKPLSDDEKEELTEDEIKKYVEKAKKGVIKGDLYISSTHTGLRGDVLSTVTGVTGSFASLSEIGIGGATLSNGKYGKLEIDEAKLKEAISKDVDGVMEVLFKDAPTGSPEDENGIFTRMTDTISTGISGVVGRAGYGDNESLFRSVNNSIISDFIIKRENKSSLDSELEIVKQTIERIDKRLAKVEDGYWKMFSTMESALTQMNAQSAWLESQFM